MKNLSLLIICVILIDFTAIAQSNKPRGSSQLYFGQRPPGMVPEVFAPGIISTKEFEFGGTFTNNGEEFFFTRRPTYEGDENRIYYTKLIKNGWASPVLSPISMNCFEFEPVISPVEDKIFIYSERKGNRNEKYDGDLWVSKKENGLWGEAEYLLSPVNKKWCMTVSISNDKTLYFTSNYKGKRGIFKAPLVNGTYSDMEFLNEEVNSDYYSHPFISRDESFMLMDGQPTGRGNSELFISFRQDNGQWSKPKNMGEIINATKTEFGASISPDGKYLFFHRRVNGNGDIYWVDAKIIDQFR